MSASQRIAHSSSQISVRKRCSRPAAKSKRKRSKSGSSTNTARKPSCTSRRRFALRPFQRLNISIPQARIVAGRDHKLAVEAEPAHGERVRGAARGAHGAADAGRLVLEHGAAERVELTGLEGAQLLGVEPE